MAILVDYLFHPWIAGVPLLLIQPCIESEESGGSQVEEGEEVLL